MKQANDVLQRNQQKQKQDVKLLNALVVVSAEIRNVVCFFVNVTALIMNALDIQNSQTKEKLLCVVMFLLFI